MEDFDILMINTLQDFVNSIIDSLNSQLSRSQRYGGREYSIAARRLKWINKKIKRIDKTKDFNEIIVLYSQIISRGSKIKVNYETDLI